MDLIRAKKTKGCYVPFPGDQVWISVVVDSGWWLVTGGNWEDIFVTGVSCNLMDRECRMAGRDWVLSTRRCQRYDPRPSPTQSSGAARHNRRPAGEGAHLLWRSWLEQLAATEGRVCTTPTERGRHELFWQWVDETYSALHCTAANYISRDS